MSQRAAPWIPAHLLLVSLLGCALTLVACGDDLADLADAGDAGEVACTWEGCPCDENAECIGSDLYCVSGVCEVPCTVGDLDCACLEDYSCNLSEDGVQLACDSGVCAIPACEIGEIGCACSAAGGCGEGLVCSSASGLERCEVSGCRLGSLECGCPLDRVCDSGLVCQDGLCRTVACEPGASGCACRADFGCNAGLICADGDICESIDCTPGMIGCRCDDGACRAADAYCDSNERCQLTGCPEGSEGCACFEDNSCGLSSEGEPLSCDGGTCVYSACLRGDVGCICELDGGCIDRGVECVDGLCLPVGCSPGEENCSCLAGGCDLGLFCRDGLVCVDDAGYLGGECLDNNRCHRGNRCQAGVCVPCLLGSQGCACNDEDGCNAGLTCGAGICVTATGLSRSPPSDPACHTPCTSDAILEDGTEVVCPANGLLDGCFFGLECIDGCCRAPGSDACTCAVDADCPNFQACLSGLCQSSCENTEDCVAGAGCYQNVCRLSCVASGDDCPDSTYCSTLDGQVGYCLPSADRPADPEPAAVGSFTLSTPAIGFTNSNTVAEFSITNPTALTARFTVQKASHRIIREDGTVDVVFFDESEDCIGGDCPLYWLDMGEAGSTESTVTYDVVVEPHGEVWIALENADGAGVTRWTGVIEVVHESLGRQEIFLGYVEQPVGHWAGSIYYFGDFDDQGLDEWLSCEGPGCRADIDLIRGMGNAFMRVWANFRKGVVRFSTFNAVIAATQSESWRSAELQADCEAEYGEGFICYPYSGGVGRYANDPRATVPRGVVELPMAFNIRPATGDELATYCGPSATDCFPYIGRIESREALQYAGNPAIVLDFGGDPAGAGACDAEGAGGCLIYLSDLEATILVGGRYASDSGCAGDDFQSVSIPWLLPGFTVGSAIDALTGRRSATECRSNAFPYDVSAAETPEEAARLRALNASFAASNPIPDGRARVRRLELVDGMLIENRTLYVLFRERTSSFLEEGGDDLVSYGLMTLTRQSADLDESAYEGNRVPAPAPTASRLMGTSCNEFMEELHAAYPEMPPQIDPSVDLDAVVAVLLDGVVTSDEDPETIDCAIGHTCEEAVHYFCEDTGLFDGGPSDSQVGSYDDDGRWVPSSATKIPCPIGSRVTFFTVDPAQLSQADIAAEPCQTEQVPCAHDGDLDCGTCRETLDLWVANGSYDIRLDPPWRCWATLQGTEQHEVYCSETRIDLRADKEFFSAGEVEAVFMPIEADIDDAFRYRTRFQNRTSGATVGFVPEICVPGSSAIPYCYDPPAIEWVETRVACALDLYEWYFDELSDHAQTDLVQYLRANFGYEGGIDEETGLPNATRYGFEHLSAELLIMLGDDAYADAMASRFDLAGSGVAEFAGSSLEPGGIDLSGAAGFEMERLYEATQYYQLALDRFYTMSPTIGAAIGSPDSFITQATVVSYFDRLIRASTQKARAFSEIARRYQNLNRPDLARRVIERGYTGAYLESTVFNHLMQQVVTDIPVQYTSQIERQVDVAQLTYRITLTEMQGRYADISDELNYFGFPPDYVPFPVLEVTMARDNPVEVMINRSWMRLNIAQEAEQAALASSRAFETDSAAFQNELARIRTTYEAQLAEICGTFQGDDGRIYPAISRYAYLSEATRLLGNPCGQVGTGAIHQAMGQIQISVTALRRVLTTMSNVHQQSRIEQERWQAQCDAARDYMNREIAIMGERSSIQGEIDRNQTTIQRTQRGLAELQGALSMATSPWSPGWTAAAYTVAAGAAEAVTWTREDRILSGERRVRALEMELIRLHTDLECDQLEIDGLAHMETIMLQVAELEVDALRAQYEIEQSIAQMRQLANQAIRIEAEMEEMEQLTINIEAARNNPNFRIYRNDAIIRADRTFFSAVREVYMATRVLEYYTSQSYANLDQLFLVRMVTAGDVNLQQYLIELEDELRFFEDQYGMPDARLARLSLRDDILQIPYLDSGGEALSENERDELFIERLTDTSFLDENGYIVIPFNTSRNDISPLTWGHKIRYVEAEIIGSIVGDPIGRVYLRMAGTGSVVGRQGDWSYYAFPERLSVINTFFNSDRLYTPEVYQSSRLNGRPFLNSRWELIVNQVDESVNEDINLRSVNDIRLYIYYSDFTEF
ncbi:MAG: hypothetical protein JW797_14045 [Bradymonadales bacterium]|nr:hypothetical protein [Bradymonadales bacterium]